MGLLIVALPILAGFAIRALKVWGDKVLSDLECNKPSLHWALEQAAEVAVRAAEKMNLSGFVANKKSYAMETVQSFLNEAGWEEINLVLLEAAVEAEVLKQFPK
jgi:hypothetical protein